ncbi:NADP-binding protein, partial [Dacryopinax primogenitus]
MAEERRLVVIVTGANSGVGQGICERLVLQMAGALPPLDTPISQEDVSSATSITLIMACRNKKRAAAARTKVLDRLEQSGDQERLRERLRIEPEDLDLGSLHSVYRFCMNMQHKYGYITHLFLNAGTGNFTGVNWPLAAWQIVTEGTHALIYPRYKVQGLGAMTEDGYGLVWQTCVFGHFMMVRLLAPLLVKSPFSDARVIWTTSVEADIAAFETDDWQLFKDSAPYDAAKYQQELLSFSLDQEFAQQAETRHVRSFAIEPGVCATSIYTETLGWFLDKAMILCLHLCRLAGSPTHVVDPFKGAVGAIYVALVALSLLPSVGEPTRYGARCHWLGQEYPEKVLIDSKHWDMKKAADLKDNCNRLCDSLVQKFKEEDASEMNGVANEKEN